MWQLSEVHLTRCGQCGAWVIVKDPDAAAAHLIVYGHVPERPALPPAPT